MWALPFLHALRLKRRLKLILIASFFRFSSYRAMMGECPGQGNHIFCRG